MGSAASGVDLDSTTGGTGLSEDGIVSGMRQVTPPGTFGCSRQSMSRRKMTPVLPLHDPLSVWRLRQRKPPRSSPTTSWNRMAKDIVYGLERKEVIMDWNRVEGNWKQVKGAVKQQWGKLTDDDLTQINGSEEKLEGIIQERYGIAKDETRKQIDSWYQNQSWQ